MSGRRISVMQVIDSLAFGGAERMAVNVANSLPRNRFHVHLCSTRGEGPLATQIRDDVGRLTLNRSTRLSEPRAVYCLVRYIRQHDIRILHCHQTTVFLCSLATLFCPSVAIVWHDHWGEAERPRWLYRIGTLRAQAVVAVNEHLATWARERLGFAKDRVYFVRNFVVPSITKSVPELPATIGCRVVCVANLRPQKDIVNLVDAMARVVRDAPDTQVLVVGSQPDLEYLTSVKEAITNHGLEDRVILLGARDNVSDILALCDIGVLSSRSEGLPLALIEYGMAGLASVATQVGQCEEVLDSGRAGLLVPPCDPVALADAVLQLVRSDSLREALGTEFRRTVINRYGSDQSVREIVDIYDALLVGSHSSIGDAV